MSFDKKQKSFYFGLGIGVCGLLAALLVYGVVAANTERANPKDLTQHGTVQKPLNFLTKANARFIDTLGQERGEALIQEGPHGVLIALSLQGLPPGYHSIHIHDKGNCTTFENGGAPKPDDYFSNAGGHLNPDGREHGMFHENGPHAGDLLNIYVADNGTLEAQLFNTYVTLHPQNNADLAFLLDEDGSALIIHEGADDYRTQPTGDTGDRIACAVIEKL